MCRCYIFSFGRPLNAVVSHVLEFAVVVVVIWTGPDVRNITDKSSIWQKSLASIMWMIQKNKSEPTTERQPIGAASKPLKQVKRVGEICLSTADKHMLCLCSETFSTANAHITNIHFPYKCIYKSLKLWQVLVVWSRRAIIGYIWSKDHRCANINAETFDLFYFIACRLTGSALRQWPLLSF